ncbi:hypothetical protein [Ohtaekwangia sp.]|uniref:hypothetical protein n=1 Tax=Ohtaekwangia sp. TaxID=2066019 RepID=UPI002FDD4BF8
MKVYFKSEFFKITYLQDINIIASAWTTPPSSEEFRQGMEHLLHAIQHFKTGKLISDTTYMGAIFPEDQEWAATDWYQRAAAAGFSHNAIIVPHDIFTELSVETILDRVDKRMIRAFFDNENAAMEWIRQF